MADDPRFEVRRVNSVLRELKRERSSRRDDAPDGKVTANAAVASNDAVFEHYMLKDVIPTVEGKYCLCKNSVSESNFGLAFRGNNKTRRTMHCHGLVSFLFSDGDGSTVKGYWRSLLLGCTDCWDSKDWLSEKKRHLLVLSSGDPLHMTKRDIFAFMAKRKLGVLGTIGPESRPQSSLVGIAITQGLDIVFDTVKSSRKYGNLTARPYCSFSIGWEGEKTLQFEGTATELSGGDLNRLKEIYFAVWPECRAHLAWPDIVYFVVRPHWIRYSDYNQNPLLIQEFTFNGRNELWRNFCSL